MSKITKSAEGEECQIRLEGICCYDPATTVFAHLNGGGMGMKQSDAHGAYACNCCHDAIDGRIQTRHSHQYIQLSFLQGMKRTQDILIKKGLIHEA